MDKYVILQELIRMIKRKGYRIVNRDYDAVVYNGRIICNLNGNVGELIRKLKKIA